MKLQIKEKWNFGALFLYLCGCVCSGNEMRQTEFNVLKSPDYTWNRYISGYYRTCFLRMPSLQ